MQLIHIVDNKITAAEHWNGSHAAAKEFADAAILRNPALKIEIYQDGGALLSHHALRRQEIG